VSAAASDAPVGVFDSGVGGLSVLRAIRAALPDENLLYLADSRHAPYGERDPAFVIERVERIAAFLLARGAKALVIACNTATVLGAGHLRGWCPVPVVGIEPAIKPAAAHTRSGVVGVLATSRTVASDAVARLCDRFGQGVRIVAQGCPGLVELVEGGAVDDPATRALLARYVAPMLAAGADTIVLGCTHYAFLAGPLRAIVGPAVQIVEPAPAVARELARRLGDSRRAADATRPPTIGFYSSAPLDAATARIGQLWGEPVRVAGFDA
jgi:glutamate racemase